MSHPATDDIPAPGDGADRHPLPPGDRRHPSGEEDIQVTPAAEPVEQVRIAVIGTGFGGIGMGVNLLRAGIRDFVLLERAGAVGGTWRDNTYPGCACDVPSHLYSFSFAPNPRWPHSFSAQPDIRAYLERVTDDHGLRPHIRLRHDVRQARWDQRAGHWRIETSQGAITATVLVSAAGPLADPALPDIPGLSSFTGRIFHSARWDHDHPLDGQRVAVIGTGASAVQFVPKIQPLVRQLTVFQRTPAWVLPRSDRALSSLETALFSRVKPAQLTARAGIYLARESAVPAFVRWPAMMGAAGALARRHLHRQVKDDALRAKLTPDYTIGCKRILLSNDYYPALAQPNTAVVASGLAELREHTAVAEDGTAHDVDTVIFGTGFHTTDLPVAERVIGRTGRSLAETWRDTGMRALRGTTVPGFPNLFFLIGPNTGLGHTSMVFIIESQIAYVMDALRQLTNRGLASLEPTESAHHRWNDDVQRRLRRTVWQTGGCASWYQDASGNNPTLWPRSTISFRRATRRLDLTEYAMVPHTPSTANPSGPPAASPAAHPSSPVAPAGRPEPKGTVPARKTGAATGRPPLDPYTAPPPEATRRLRSADGTPLHTSVHGDPDAPTVILVHGWTCSTRFWGPVVHGLLTEGLRVVLYDQRGHGGSGPPGAAGYTTGALADDLETVVRAYVPDGERAVLGTHSMGGMSVLAATDRPLVQERTAAVLLASTGSHDLLDGLRVLPIRSPRARRLAHRLLATSPLPMGPPNAVTRALLRRGTMGRDATRDQAMFCADIVTACPRLSRAAWGRLLNRLDLAANVPRLRAPTTVLVGMDDRMTPMAHAEYLAARLPHLVEYVKLPRVGHMSPVEAPNEVVTALLRLVREYLPQHPPVPRHGSGPAKRRPAGDGPQR